MRRAISRLVGLRRSLRRLSCLPLRLPSLLLLLSTLLLASNCAVRGPSLPHAADVASADPLVREGCYRCLEGALAVYERLVAAPRPPERTLRGAFDVTLLLAVRRKELGLVPQAHLAQARTLLSRLSPAARAPSHGEAWWMLAAAVAVVGNISGLDSEERQQRDQAAQLRAPAATTEPEPSLSDGRMQQALHEASAANLTAAYLALAIDCEQPRAGASIVPDRVLVQHGGPPLMQYRLAICSRGSVASLTRLREADPRWADTFFFEGVYEMGSPSRPAEPSRAVPLLASASEAFPESLAIQLALADAQESNGDFAAALVNVDRVLASKPGHVDALLARVRNLSSLGRSGEGVAAATVLIDLGTWHVGDAYYWRAWNAYQLRRLDPAWTDIQQAMSLLSNTSVYALAGSIAYARRELDAAVVHFDRAFDIDNSNCLAVWSAGLVHIDQEVWQPAAAKFSKATGCFTTTAAHARADLARLEASDLAPTLKASRAAATRKRIESAEQLAAQSALHAAQGYLRTGEKDSALAYVALAANHPAMRAQAAALKPLIDKMP